MLLETLREYFDAGEVATEAARRLHVSVRTVTYRLARVAQLTGYRVSRPDQRFSLHAPCWEPACSSGRRNDFLRALNGSLPDVGNRHLREITGRAPWATAGNWGTLVHDHDTSTTAGATPS